MKYILKNKGKGTHGGTNPVSVNDLYRLDTPEVKSLTDIEVRSYNDLQDLPIIPSTTSQLNNDSGFITGLTWDEVTEKPTLNITNWDNAFSWGNHALQGYSKTDTTYLAGNGLNLVGTTFSVKYGTTTGTAAQGNDNRIQNGNTAFGWGNHATQGYIKSYTDTTYSAGAGLDLVGTTFSIEFGTTTNTVAAGNDSRITNGATAYSWGNHASQGYITGLSWSQLTGKPTSFTPSAHNHDDRYYTETEIDTKLSGKANSVHTHVVADITDFPTIPDSTSDLTNDSGFITGVSWTQVTSKPTLDNYQSWSLKTNGLHRTTVQSGGTLDLVAGDNINLVYGAGGVVTISSTASGGTTDGNNYVTGIDFNTLDGVFTLNRDGLTPLTIDLDGRYSLTGHNHDSSYAPITHTHSYNDLTDKPNTFTAWGIKVDDEINANYIGNNETINLYGGANVTITRPGGANTYQWDVAIPTNVSAFTNDAGYLTSVSVPDSTSDLTNDSGFITSAALPTNVSELNNDAGYITANEVPDAQVVEGTIDITASRTLTTADKGKTIIVSGTTTLTIPSTLGTDFSVDLINDGSGVVTIAQGSGTTLKAPHGLKLLPGYSANILKRTGANTFYIQGELTT